MSTLHTVAKSPFERNALTTALSHLQPGDSLLLFEDAVIAALKDGLFANMIAQFASECRVYTLEPDAKARGIKPVRYAQGILPVDYAGFVDLVEQNQRVCAWV